MNKQIGKYKIINQSYGSSDSILYNAMDTETSETVALKKINPSLYNDENKIARLQNEVRLAEEHSNLMLDATPICFTFWNENLELIDCNDAVLRLFCIYDKNIFIENFFAFVPEYQENGMLSKDMFKQGLQKAINEGRYVFEWMHQDLMGVEIPTEVTLVKINYGGSHRIAGFIRDLRE